MGGVVAIEEPLHGAILNRRHGQQAENGLKIRVSGGAPLGDQVTVNKTPATRSGAGFASEVVLREKETEIVAASKDPRNNNLIKFCEDELCSSIRRGILNASA